MQNYAATSLFTNISNGTKNFGLNVLAAAPGVVESGINQSANMKMSMSLTPEQVSVPILKTLGCKTIVLTGLLTKILVTRLEQFQHGAK